MKAAHCCTVTCKAHCFAVTAASLTPTTEHAQQPNKRSSTGAPERIGDGRERQLLFQGSLNQNPVQLLLERFFRVCLKKGNDPLPLRGRRRRRASMKLQFKRVAILSADVPVIMV
jgi:hypothetical protein